MKKISIAAIAPYEGLQNSMRAAAAQFSEIIDVDIIAGNLEECVRYVHLFSMNKYDLIISRGGTAEYLHNITAIPVIEIEISVYDMLHALKAAEQLTDNFAVVGFPKIVSMARLIKDILQYPCEIIEITSETEASALLSDLHERQNPPFIIGDTVTVQLASRMGISSHLITSGRESVEKAYQSAIQYSKNLSRLSLDKQVFRGILEHLDTSIIVYNGQHQLYYHNLARRDSDYFALFDYTSACIDKLAEADEINLIKRQSPYIFQIHGKVLKLDKDAFYLFYVRYTASRMHHDSFLAIEDFEDTATDFKLLQARTALIKDLSDMIDVLSDRAVSVYIQGEFGCGADIAAKHLHQQVVGTQTSMITINCKLVSSKGWNALIEDAASPLNAVGYSIYFKDIHLLSSEMHVIIDNYISDTVLSSRCFLLSSSTPHLERMLEGGQFPERLYRKLTGVHFQIPPISEYPEDIPALSQIFINKFNELMGKDVIGFEHKAMEILKNHNYWYNMHQLEQIVQQLVISCKGFYISEAEVKCALRTSASVAEHSPILDYSKSLEEIEADIIRRVLVEENMNQTKAAQRLCISRSTLWRKLK